MGLPGNVEVTEKVLLTATSALHLLLRHGSTNVCIRDSHKDLHALAIEGWKVCHAIFLSGSPGVGKSFLLHCLSWGTKKCPLCDDTAKLHRSFTSNPEEVFHANTWLAFHAEADAADVTLVDPPQNTAKSQELTLNQSREKVS